LGGISYVSSRDHPEIQVADLYCYLQARALSGRPVTPAQYAALEVVNKRRPDGIEALTAPVYDMLLERIAEKTLAELAALVEN
jgi:hypothetical protein